MNKNVAGMYALPDRSSEQVSQAILGQAVECLEDAPGWRRVRTHDDYSGWIESRWLMDARRGSAYAAAGKFVRVANLFAEILAWPDPGAEVLTKAVIGTDLELADQRDDWVLVRLPDGTQGAIRRFAVDVLDRAVHPLPLAPTGWEIAATARRFVGVPYLWGGVTPFGLDCSGLAQLVHRLHDVLIPRDAHLQAEDSRFVTVELDSLQAGDLLFFVSTDDKRPGRKINHVGIALDKDRFIHSSGGAGVAVTEIAEPGYSSILTLARRLT